MRSKRHGEEFRPKLGCRRACCRAPTSTDTVRRGLSVACKEPRRCFEFAARRIAVVLATLSGFESNEVPRNNSFDSLVLLTAFVLR